MTLTRQQLRHLEQRLLEERARVVAVLERQELATERETPSEAAGDIAPTRVDRGTESQFQELDVINAERATAELTEIDAALDRLYHNPDAYGRDERTGQPIPFARLDIIPWARTTVASR
jgi:RNA polymerase-binding transcription factor DksA